MSRKNEDNIEKFFRKGVRQSDTTFRESDWLDLEKRLDEQAQLRAAERARFLRRTFIAGSGILLIAVSVYFFMPAGEQTQSLEQRSTVNDAKSTVHGPQSEIRPTQQPDNSSQASDGQTHQPDTRNLRSENQASPSDGQSAAATTAGRESLKRNGVTTTTALSAHKRTADNTGSEIQTATVKQPADQNTPPTRKPRQPERSGAPAISKTVTPAPIVATAPERSGHDSSTGETDEQNTAIKEPSTAQAVSAASGTEPTTAAKADRSVEAQSAIPTAATAVSTPNARYASGVQEEDTSSNDQTTAPLSDGEAGRSATVADVTTSKEKPGTAASALTSPTIAPRQTEASSKKDQPIAPIANGQSTATTPSTLDSVLLRPPKLVSSEGGWTVDRGLLARRSVSVGGSTEQRQIAEKQTPQDTTDLSDIVQKDTTAQTDKQAEPLEKENKPRIPSRWNAALVLAPDFSSMGFGGEMSAPGKAFGVLIGFRVSRKLTVVGGVISSTKKYEGYGKDYTPPEGYWQKRTNGVVPDEILGSCTIVEAPIIVQYDVRQSTRSRLYISGGVSSYFMRRQEYDYKFNQPNDGADRRWASNTPTTYAFRVGHLSVAYEIMLNKHLGVGVEPYIKIPFQGIGWPNISLYTTGAYVNVRYFLLRKNVE